MIVPTKAHVCVCARVCCDSFKSTDSLRGCECLCMVFTMETRHVEIAEDYGPTFKSKLARQEGQWHSEYENGLPGLKAEILRHGSQRSATTLPLPLPLTLPLPLPLPLPRSPSRCRSRSRSRSLLPPFLALFLFLSFFSLFLSLFLSLSLSLSRLSLSLFLSLSLSDSESGRWSCQVWRVYLQSWSDCFARSRSYSSVVAYAVWHVMTTCRPSSRRS